MPMQRYGWKRQLPDQRDWRFQSLAPTRFPSYVDLRSGLPPIYDQEQLGSCTANAGAGAIAFDQFRQKLPQVEPSRLFIYYNERVIEGTVPSDSGATLRDCMKAMADYGACSEVLWPYDTGRFAVKPSPQAYAAGLAHKGVSYWAVGQDLNSMRGCLAQRFPFVFGFSVYDSFESNAVAKTGVVPMPSASESMLGGHAVLCIGYNEKRQQFWCRNSWGAGWGLSGYFWMPYAYLLSADLSGDFWTLRSILS